jgi:hypothetical protein
MRWSAFAVVLGSIFVPPSFPAGVALRVPAEGRLFTFAQQYSCNSLDGFDRHLLVNCLPIAHSPYLVNYKLLHKVSPLFCKSGMAVTCENKCMYVMYDDMIILLVLIIMLSANKCGGRMRYGYLFKLCGFLTKTHSVKCITLCSVCLNDDDGGANDNDDK